MELKLVVRHPELPPAEYVVESQPMVVGREATCDIQIPSNYVSRRHFQIEPAGDDFRYVDLGGKNPVLLNGQPIDCQHSGFAEEQYVAAKTAPPVEKG